MNKNTLPLVALVGIVVLFVGGCVLYYLNTSQTPSLPTGVVAEPVHEITPEMQRAFEFFVRLRSINWKIDNVQYNPMCDGSEAYDVAVSNPSGLKTSFILDRAGKLIQSEVDKNFSEASVPLKDILKKNYSGYTYGDTYESLQMASGEERYLIDLSQNGGKTTSELILAKDGSIICQTNAK
jgi:hypothetical protein